MQSRFTDKAQEALSYASRCARSLKQGYVGTEHILVGLLKEQSGVAYRVLDTCKGTGGLFSQSPEDHRGGA